MIFSSLTGKAIKDGFSSSRAVDDPKTSTFALRLKDLALPKRNELAVDSNSKDSRERSEKLGIIGRKRNLGGGQRRTMEVAILITSETSHENKLNLNLCN